MSDESQPTESQPTQREIFIRNLFLTGSVHTAAIKAGYSPGYAKGGIYNLIKTPRMQDDIRAYAIAHDILDIPKALMIESKILARLGDIAADDPDEAIKMYPKLHHLLKQKKQSAGVLKQDAVPVTQTINVTDARQLMIQVNVNKDKQHIPGGSPKAIDINPGRAAESNE